MYIKQMQRCDKPADSSSWEPVQFMLRRHALRSCVLGQCEQPYQHIWRLAFVFGRGAGWCPAIAVTT